MSLLFRVHWPQLPALLLDLAVEIENIENQKAIDREQNGGANGGVNRGATLMSEERVHRNGEQPKLHYDADANQRQQYRKESCSSSNVSSKSDAASEFPNSRA